MKRRRCNFCGERITKDELTDHMFDYHSGEVEDMFEDEIREKLDEILHDRYEEVTEKIRRRKKKVEA